jgi:hypothetical protein
VAGLLVLVLTGSAGVYLASSRPDPGNGDALPSAPGSTVVPTPPTAPGTPRAGTGTVKPGGPDPRKVRLPRTGPGRYDFAPGRSPVFGTRGQLRRYRVAVEQGVPVSAADFAARVDQVLSDRRSWIAGNVRLRRVARDERAAFTVYLVTAGTARTLCLAGGYDIFWRGEPYTSCRVGGRVVINLTRYLRGIPKYGAPLSTYQEYAINHEVGHALGHDHELCPGRGRPAPVMVQQTFSLQGCTAYSWPYRNGRRYAGPPGRIVPN